MMASERSLRPKRDIDWKKLHFGEALPIEKAQIKRAPFVETFEVERLISRKISKNEVISFFHIIIECTFFYNYYNLIVIFE